MNEVIEEYHITADNIYNVDEKGFLIGIGTKMRRIMLIERIQEIHNPVKVRDGFAETSIVAGTFVRKGNPVTCVL